MFNLAFTATLAVTIGAVLLWAYRRLPKERWQMIASIPLSKTDQGLWHGLNLTFYGFFSATGCVFGIAIATVLLSSVHISMKFTLLLVTAVMGLCLPASRIVAAIVEKKSSTYTVAGAAFVAAIILPPTIWVGSLVLQSWALSLDPLPVMAAVGIAYALAEAIGRMACMSFGCCYGMPLRDLSPKLARLFGRFHTTFYGNTKKAAYASGLEAEPLIPVQALTSAVFASAGLIGLAFFLAQRWRTALVICVIGTWGWRAVAERLRADHRGRTRISVYQIMSLAALLYLLGAAVLFPAGGPEPDLLHGLAQLTKVGVVVALQLLWIALFLFYGRSKVTASFVSFHVVTDGRSG